MDLFSFLGLVLAGGAVSGAFRAGRRAAEVSTAYCYLSVGTRLAVGEVMRLVKRPRLHGKHLRRRLTLDNRHGERVGKERNPYIRYAVRVPSFNATTTVHSTTGRLGANGHMFHPIVDGGDWVGNGWGTAGAGLRWDARVEGLN